MTNNLQVFDNGLGELRVTEKDNQVWFVAKDVCDVLEIQNTSDALKRLDEDERASFNLGRQGNANVINESGLYSLILASRKPQAKAFKSGLHQRYYRVSVETVATWLRTRKSQKRI